MVTKENYVLKGVSGILKAEFNNPSSDSFECK